MDSLHDSSELTMSLETGILPVRETTEEMPISVIGPYRLLKKIGTGGMGEVYLAEDERLNRRIALKMPLAQYTQDTHRVRRFVREARAASALNHPNIITIFDIGEAQGNHYIATEYIQGQTLRQRMAKHVTIAEALELGLQMASALNAAHEAGIIHRDIKPENIMLRPDGLLKVLDFGIAKLTEKHLAAEYDNQEIQITDAYADQIDPYRSTPEVKSGGTAPGIMLGTVTYMSPEQLRWQKVDIRTDIFSLGIVLYEVIVGRPPFSGQTQADKIAAILEHVPEPLSNRRPDTPPELEWVIKKALEKDRDSRYQNIKDFLADLQAIVEKIEFQEMLERCGQDGMNEHLNAPKSPWRQRWGRMPTTAIVVVGIVTTFVGANIYLRLSGAAVLPDRSPIVRPEFSNTADDPSFDGVWLQGLVSKLEQPPFLKLISDDNLVQTLLGIVRSQETKGTQQLACEGCRQTGDKAIVEGSTTGLANPLETRLSAFDYQSNDGLAETREMCSGKDGQIEQPGNPAAKLCEKVGESLTSEQTNGAPTDNFTTSLLKTLQVYFDETSEHTGLGIDAVDYRLPMSLLKQADLWSGASGSQSRLCYYIKLITNARTA
jgi:serine/threonine protein kinase